MFSLRASHDPKSLRLLARYLVIACLTLGGCEQATDSTVHDGPLMEFLKTDSGAVFSEVRPGVAIKLPEDHGAHESFRQEWWYFSGNLKDNEDRAFSYQFTLFRFANDHQAQVAGDWDYDQTWMGHFVVADHEQQVRYVFEDFSRQALGLAGATTSPLAVWLNSWSIRQLPENCSGCFAIRLQASRDDVSIDLDLVSDRPPVLHGDEGFSRKDQSGQTASYYYSYPAMKTRGLLSTDGGSLQVNGFSWFDHEWSTRVLAREQSGWDWFGLRLSDQSNLMLFRLRDELSGDFMSATLRDPNGHQTQFDHDQIQLEARRYWTTRDNVSYPVSWHISISDINLDLEIDAVFDHQEVNTGFRYWEGSVKAHGAKTGSSLSGEGYMELTGYD